MKHVSFVVPGKPTGKQRPRFTQAGKFARAYTPKETVTYEQEIKRYALEAGVSVVENAAVSVCVVAVWSMPKSWSIKKRDLNRLSPRPSKPDGDNVLKAVCDALEGIAYAHDGQVWKGQVYTIYGDVPQTYVQIEYVVEGAFVGQFPGLLRGPPR